MSILFSILAATGALLFIFFVWRRSYDNFFWPALAFKVFSGIIVGFIYHYYYGNGDTFSFYQDSLLLVNVIEHEPIKFLTILWNKDPVTDGLILANITDRSFFFVKWSAFFVFLSFGNYWIASVYFSLLSFFGSWYLFRKITGIFASNRYPAAVAFLFYPSVVFWGSGLMKESIAIASLFTLSAIFLDGYYYRSVVWQQWIMGFISLWILWNLKYYWAACWLVVAIPGLATHWASIRWVQIRKFQFLLWLFVFVFSGFAATILHPNFNLDRIMQVIVDQYHTFNILSSGNKIIRFYNLEPTFLSFLINSPIALISGIYRPFVWEANNVLNYAAAFENLVLLVASLYLITTWSRLRFEPLLLTLLVYCAILFTLLALSTPNFGSLSRFRIGAMPFLVFLISSGIQKGFKNKGIAIR